VHAPLESLPEWLLESLGGSLSESLSESLDESLSESLDESLELLDSHGPQHWPCATWSR
jgi:hypothetical protein